MGPAPAQGSGSGCGDCRRADEPAADHLSQESAAGSRDPGPSCPPPTPQDGVNAVIGAGKFLAMIEEHAREHAIQHPLVGSPTIAPVLVAGGEALNMVPERCTLTFDRRLVPGEEEAAVITRLTTLLTRFNREAARAHRAHCPICAQHGWPLGNCR